MRALAGDPATSVPWLTEPLRAFGDRLGAVLYRIPDPVKVDVARLTAMLSLWPRDLPLVVEAQDPSWRDDEVHRRLAEAGAVLCATELPEDDEPPTVRLTGPFLYLRLRRHDYEPAAIEAWADRLAPFLESGRDAYAFFRHDEVGRATELATALADAVERRVGEAAVVRG
jgi:uncharacterized protein YecE (DUF72 family)